MLQSLCRFLICLWMRMTLREGHFSKDNLLYASPAREHNYFLSHFDVNDKESFHIFIFASLMLYREPRPKTLQLISFDSISRARGASISPKRKAKQQYIHPFGIRRAFRPGTYINYFNSLASKPSGWEREHQNALALYIYLCLCSCDARRQNWQLDTVFQRQNPRS